MGINIGQIRIKKKNILNNDLMVAIIICFSLINGAVGVDNISYLTIAVVSVLFVKGFISGDIHFYKKSILVLFAISISFVISYCMVIDDTYTTLYLIYFLGFGIVSFLSGMQEIDIEKTLLYVEYIGVICVFIFFFRGFNNYDASLRMGISYSLLPVFFISLVSIFTKRIRIVSFVNVVLSLYFYVSIAPRGLWLTLGIFTVLYFFYIFSRNANGNRQIIIQFVLLLVVSVGIVFVYYNLELILSSINSMYYAITGKSVYALEKFAFLLSSGNLSNGRYELSNDAKVIIENHIICGRGIGYFESIEDGLYVHNVLLQALCEAGIFFLIPVIWMLIRGINTLLSCKSGGQKSKYVFFLIIFVNGLIILFYSSVYWKNILFWYLLGYQLQFSQGISREKVKE